MHRIRLLPCLAIAQAAGIALADHRWLDSDAALWLGASAIAVGLLAAKCVALRTAMAGVVSLSVGAHALAQQLEAAAIGRPSRRVERTLEATIDAHAIGPSWFRTDLGHVIAADAVPAVAPMRVRVFGARTPGEIPALERLPRGARVRARVVLRPPREAVNPGVRSRLRDLERAGFGAVGRLAHPALHVTLSNDPEIGIAGQLDALRHTLSDRIARAGSGSGLLRALALGDRSGLGATARDAFRKVGLSHLLAVSGLHLALLGGFGFAVTRALVGRVPAVAARWDTRSGSLVAAVATATVYALLTGWGVPVRRAWVLLLAIGFAIGRQRRLALAEPISAAAVVVLLSDPDALFDPGAQLSFSAASALALSARRVKEHPADIAGAWGWFRRAIDAGLRASASAVAATAPLAAWHFGSVSPIGLFSNVLAIPWTGVVLLPSALIAAIGAALELDFPARWASGVAVVTLEAIAFVARSTPTFPPTAQPGWCWMGAVAGLALAAIVARRTLVRVALAIAVNVAMLAAPTVALAPGPPRWVALDVGQGSASVLQGERSAILFDAGGASPNGDWGRRAVLPALSALGIRRIDIAVVSHGDLDHRGGLPSVLERVPVGEIWVPFGSRGDAAFETIRELAGERHVPIVERGAGSIAILSDGVRIVGLWPPQPVRGAVVPGRNNRSLVVRVEVGATRLLLPGDIESAAERELLATGDALRADVLAIPHHGSRSSSSDVFLAAVDAQLGIASAPCEGRFEMPHAETRVRLRDARTSLWWTGRDGAVLVGLGSPLTVWGFRDGPEPCRQIRMRPIAPE